jgi:O-antigen/teichoic acid export membrane protein
VWRVDDFWRVGIGVVRASVGFVVASFILVTYQQIDTVIISLFVEPEVLGWYAIADMLFGSLLFLPTIVATSIFPALGRLHAHDQDGLVALVRRTFHTIMAVGVPLGLGTMIVAGQITPLLFGEEFRPAGEVLFVLGPVIILTFATVLFGTVAMAIGRRRLWNVVMAVGVAMTILLDLVFVPWTDRRFDNGAIGGAMAYVVTEGMMVIVGLATVVSFLATRVTAERLMRTGVAGALMFAASWPLRDQFILIPIVVAVIVYAAAAIALGVVGHDERQLVLRALKRGGA